MEVSSMAVVAVFVAAMLSAVSSVSTQFEAPAPAPSMDTGSAFSTQISFAALFFSLVLSLIALSKH
ncbi:hypothetical protein Syun_023371 [Stephania yunnanensis]|uniref:Uncharacterized protein n=1 Tax=Stephania yunnanensis TaxID=152371 RepID=A0AAP0FBL8_9MAGN